MCVYILLQSCKNSDHFVQCNFSTLLSTSRDVMYFSIEFEENHDLSINSDFINIKEIIQNINKK